MAKIKIPKKPKLSVGRQYIESFAKRTIEVRYSVSGYEILAKLGVKDFQDRDPEKVKQLVKAYIKEIKP